ncbi:MAG: translation initiation factor IF-3 [Candidatus Magasanikbacteria bacterium]|nr:translation initiation factor IF-3 [Candidatus Magasanikbacteria bacterium]
MDMGLTPITSTITIIMRISRYHYKRNKEPAVRVLANEYIRAPQVMVIDENGANLGIISTREALATAQERGFDLVLVNPVAEPPVAKLLNYGQFKYEKEKELKKQKLTLKQIDVKGVRLTPRIGAHDLEMRQNQAIKFLEGGNKIKIEIVMRGRERQHKDLAFNLLNNFINFLKQKFEIKIEQNPATQGGRITAILGGEKKQ